MSNKSVSVNTIQTESPGKPPKQPKANSSEIIVLRMQSRVIEEKTIEKLEEKYSKKFGCKVVILEGNLEMVNYING